MNLQKDLNILPNLDGVSKGDSLIINEQGNPAWGSTLIVVVLLLNLILDLVLILFQIKLELIKKLIIIG